MVVKAALPGTARVILLALCPAVLLAAQPPADQAIVRTLNLDLRIPVRSWAALRDQGIVKQAHDFSCGAASVATILRYHYGRDVTELQVLHAMRRERERASFDDMQAAMPAFGFRAVGYAASYEQLTRLRIPVIVYLRHRRDSHFAVLRGAGTDVVVLADPSQGNVTMSRSQFMEMWATRFEEGRPASLAGRLLAIVPEPGGRAGSRSAPGLFVDSPTRHSAPAVSWTVDNFPPR